MDCISHHNLFAFMPPGELGAGVARAKFCHGHAQPDPGTPARTPFFCLDGSTLLIWNICYALQPYKLLGGGETCA